jgi:hypothetical protein
VRNSSGSYGEVQDPAGRFARALHSVPAYHEAAPARAQAKDCVEGYLRAERCSREYEQCLRMDLSGVWWYSSLWSEDGLNASAMYTAGGAILLTTLAMWSAAELDRRYSVEVNENDS